MEVDKLSEKEPKQQMTSCDQRKTCRLTVQKGWRNTTVITKTWKVAPFSLCDKMCLTFIRILHYDDKIKRDDFTLRFVAMGDNAWG